MDHAKQDLVQKFGHFFVIAYAAPEHDGREYIGRASSHMLVARVGRLESNWRPDPYSRIIIKEFLGEPNISRDTNSGGEGVLGDISHSEFYSGDMFYKNITDATAMAERLVKAHHETYRMARAEAAKKKLPFPKRTPKLPVTQELLPDTIEFPNLETVTEGTEIFCVDRAITDRTLRVVKSTVMKPTLKVYSAGPGFAHKYYASISFVMPKKDEPEGTGITIDRNYGFDPASSQTDFWSYYPTVGYLERYFPEGVTTHLTRETAEKAAAALAIEVTRNVANFLPKEAAAAPR